MSLLLTSYNILSNVLPLSLSPQTVEIFDGHECVLRNNSITDQNFCIRKAFEKNETKVRKEIGYL
jgi:hypothetical protein